MEQVYATPFGCCTFSQFYENTRTLAAYTLRERCQMENGHDIDDCLQVAYLKLWRRLQHDPDWMADKPKKYVMTALCFASKAQRYAHIRHENKVGEYADSRPSFTPRRKDIDTRIDLTRAIRTVAQLAEENPMLLLGLYYATTDVSANEAAQVYGCAPKTVYKHGAQARKELVEHLPGYGPVSANGRQQAAPQPLPM